MSTTIRIVKTPDVLHGKPRIKGTRIGVFTIGESVREGGQPVDDVLEAYPDLTRERITAALDYYDNHPEAMDVIRQRREATKRRLIEGSRAIDAEEMDEAP
jgi:uncharacterized protein (DUF433 family)